MAGALLLRRTGGEVQSGGGYSPPDDFATDFEGDTLGQQPAGFDSLWNGNLIQVVTDPLGQRGKVARINYQGHQDAGMTRTPTGQPVASAGFARWYFMLQAHKNPASAGAHVRDIRKLLYIQSDSWVIVVDVSGTENTDPGGSHEGLPGLFLTFTHSGGSEFLALYDPGSAPGVTFDGWHYAEVEWALNTPGQFNGIFRLWLDDPATPVYQNLAVRWRLSGNNDPIRDIIFGQQSNTTGADEYRWLDKVATSTTRIGP